MAGVVVVDFDVVETPDRPVLSRLDRQISDLHRAAELAERNAKALEEWCYHKLRGSTFTDAARSPLERHLMDRWFDARREVAQAWIARSLFFRRQAD